MLFLSSDYHIRCYEHEASFNYFNLIANNPRLGIWRWEDEKEVMK